jgi:hypothetical protein
MMDSPAAVRVAWGALEFPAGESHRHRGPCAPIRVNRYCD